MAGEAQEELVHITADSVMLEGELSVPRGAQDIVVFAHGSGSSRYSPRNKFVAQFLQKEGFGTLLFDLLTEGEDTTYETRFNINLLTDWLMKATKWLEKQSKAQDVPMGYFVQALERLPR